METCSICFEKIKTKVHLDCSHFFCKTCIENWKTLQITCPMCRMVITPMKAEPTYELFFYQKIYQNEKFVNFLIFATRKHFQSYMKTAEYHRNQRLYRISKNISNQYYRELNLKLNIYRKIMNKHIFKKFTFSIFSKRIIFSISSISRKKLISKILEMRRELKLKYINLLRSQDYYPNVNTTDKKNIIKRFKKQTLEININSNKNDSFFQCINNDYYSKINDDNNVYMFYPVKVNPEIDEPIPTFQNDLFFLQLCKLIKETLERNSCKYNENDYREDCKFYLKIHKNYTNDLFCGFFNEFILTKTYHSERWEKMKQIILESK